jgi:hypothetical protein
MSEAKLIKGLKLAIGKKEIDLTPEQARDLYSELHELYGKTVEHYHTREVIRDYPRPWWQTTWYTSNDFNLMNQKYQQLVATGGTSIALKCEAE